MAELGTSLGLGIALQGEHSTKFAEIAQKNIDYDREQQEKKRKELEKYDNLRDKFKVQGFDPIYNEPIKDRAQLAIGRLLELKKPGSIQDPYNDGVFNSYNQEFAIYSDNAKRASDALANDFKLVSANPDKYKIRDDVAIALKNNDIEAFKKAIGTEFYRSGIGLEEIKQMPDYRKILSERGAKLGKIERVNEDGTITLTDVSVPKELIEKTWEDIKLYDPVYKDGYEDLVSRGATPEVAESTLRLNYEKNIPSKYKKTLDEPRISRSTGSKNYFNQADIMTDVPLLINSKVTRSVDPTKKVKPVETSSTAKEYFSIGNVPVTIPYIEGAIDISKNEPLKKGDIIKANIGSVGIFPVFNKDASRVVSGKIAGELVPDNDLNNALRDGLVEYKPFVVLETNKSVDEKGNEINQRNILQPLESATSVLRKYAKDYDGLTDYFFQKSEEYNKSIPKIKSNQQELDKIISSFTKKFNRKPTNEELQKIKLKYGIK